MPNFGKHLLVVSNVSNVRKLRATPLPNMPPTSHNKRNEGKAKTLWFPPSRFKSQVTTVREHQVHALVGGAKFIERFLRLRRKQIPMLMIHRALASRRYLMPTANLLVKHIPVYVLDLPGHGASSKPIHALSVEEHASVISQWLDCNKLKQVFVYANSYGCQIAAQLAADRPDVMAGLVLSGSTVDPEAPTLFQQFLRLCEDSFNEPLSARVQMLVDLQEMGVGLVFETVNQ